MAKQANKVNGHDLPFCRCSGELCYTIFPYCLINTGELAKFSGQREVAIRSGQTGLKYSLKNLKPSTNFMNKI